MIRWLYQRGALGVKVAHLIQKSPFVDIFHRLNRGPASHEMPTEFKNYLKDCYKDDIYKLSQFLGRDLTHWIQKE